MNDNASDRSRADKPAAGNTHRPCRRGSAALPGNLATLVACLIMAVMAAGCASTKVTRQPLVTGQLPRPTNIWVYDFAATAADLPAGSTLAGQISADAPSPTAEDIAAGRKLGAQIADELVKQIREMGMPAKRAVRGSTPQVYDLVLRGCLLSVDEGDARKRVGIGFGSGGSELKVVAEGLQMTAQGLRKLGSSTTDATGNKTPGAALGAAVFLATKNPVGLIVSTGMKVYGEKSGSSKIEARATQTAKELADLLKARFKEQGWVN